MNEQAVRELIEQMYVHVAGMPWKDVDFLRSEVAVKAGEEQIVSHTVKEIMKLSEEKT